MNYIELKVTKRQQPDQNDLLIADLADFGFDGFIEEEGYLVAYITEDRFQEELLNHIPSFKELDEDEYHLARINDQNWNKLWESNYPPVLIGNSCFIRAPFHDPNPDATYNIVLNPKMAFGTAHHETTAMIIELLLGEDVRDKYILDMGCGTGLLAIIAAKKGARKVMAIDNDQWAFESALENISLNDVLTVEVMLGDGNLLSGLTKFDYILANINKNTLLNDMDNYATALKDNGILVLSGFYLDDIVEIKDSAKQNGMNFVSKIDRNNWVAAKFSRQ